MDDQGKYTRVWKKYVPVVRLKLKRALVAEQQLLLDELDFKAPGKRVVSGYAFNLEIDKGSVTNNISGSVVARTLVEMLKEDNVCRELLNTRQIKIRLDRGFCLHMEILAAVPHEEPG